MNYIPISEQDRKEMLEVVGVEAPTDLFSDVPREALLTEPLNLDEGLSEAELSACLKELAEKNKPASSLTSFAGAGCYQHYIPSCVDHVINKPEFFTAYTPYQPEVSQGTLQAMYEYQTDMCNLTGLELTNASMYDGATALVEAVFMAHRLAKKRDKVIVAGGIHPDYRETLDTYARPVPVDVTYVEPRDGLDDFEKIAAGIDENTAAIVVGYPNFFGSYQDFSELAAQAHEKKVLVIVVAQPLMLALMEAPGNLGADICVGDAQPFGNPMNFGGPGLGYLACTKKCMRQMPGRIIGATVDEDGHRGYVLTLSTREQHIRREKATSNICSNHALNAIAAGVYLAAVGKEGLKQAATVCVSRAHYLREKLVESDRFTRLNEAPFGYEFAVRYKGDLPVFMQYCFDHAVVPGVELDDSVLLIAVTELNTKTQLDTFIELVKNGD